MLKLLFWASAGLVVYVYVGYPVLVDLLSRWRGVSRDAFKALPQLPSVTVLIPAHNEEQWIRRKIENTLDLEYPKGQMEIVVASDGSDDRTAVIAGEFADRGVRVVAFPTRLGKQEMLNRVVPKATGEIIVATDTNALLARDALRKLLRHFSDPAVGGA